jgi:hypothetical protein
MTAAVERDLRDAGATDALLRALHEIASQAAPAAPAPACRGDESAAHGLACADLKVSATRLRRIPSAGTETGASVIFR